MSGPDRDEGLAALAAATLAVDAPPAELRVRYSRDPAALDAGERATVEAWMAASPANRDQMELLRGTDLNALVQEALSGADAGPVAGRAGLRERLSSWLATPWPGVLAASGAAVLLGIFLWGGDREVPGAGGTDVARVDPPPLPGPEPGGVLPAPALPDPLPVPGATDPPPPDPAPDPSSAPGREPRGGSAVPEAPGEAPPPIFTARPDEAAIDYLAMAEIDYRDPLDAEPRERLRSYVRGDSADPGLLALVPAHVAETAVASPLLPWRIERVPARGTFVLTVADETSIDPLLETVLPVPAGPGRQWTDLASFGAELEIGRVYRWTIRHGTDPDNPSRGSRTEGWVRRVEREVEPTADPARRATLLARAGLWYDALAQLRRLPAHPARDAALQRLLGEAGLP